MQSIRAVNFSSPQAEPQSTVNESSPFLDVMELSEADLSQVGGGGGSTNLL